MEELERENAELRAKYAKALDLLRRYKQHVELNLSHAQPDEKEPPQTKVTNMWRERLLRMNSLSPRKEPVRKQEDVLELAAALNSGDFQLNPLQNSQDNLEEISKLYKQVN
jgi:hypothetical protein